jgi:hypothetical protein
MKHRLHLWLLLPLLVAACSTTPPVAEQSRYFKSNAAGLGWYRNGEASAVFALTILPAAPDELYVEAVLANPLDPASPTRIRRQVSRADGSVTFEGPRTTGWRNGARYRFSLLIYEDPQYTRMIGRHDQELLVQRPPESMLRQLRE